MLPLIRLREFRHEMRCRPPCADKVKMHAVVNVPSSTSVVVGVRVK